MRWVARILFLPFLLASTLAQERAVVVKNSDNELVRTAHRLGVGPDKIAQARQFLREASELALDLSETEEINTLGQYWIMLDRDDAGDQLSRLLRELSRRAGRTPDLSAYQRMSRNARAWAEPLRVVKPAAAEEILAKWPEAPAQTAESLAESQRLDRRFEENRLRARIRDDVDGGLQELRELEKDGPFLSVRVSALSELLRSRRIEDASALFDETVDLATSVPPSQESLGALRNLLVLYSRMGTPEQIDQLFATWASQANAVEIPGGARTIEGIEFSARENNILNTLRSLAQSPELALQSLELFPDLSEKLKPIGGLGGIFSSMNRGAANRREETDEELTDLEREIQQRTESINRPDLSNPDRQAEEIETTLRLLRQLERPEKAADYFLNLAVFYFGLQGELPSEFRRQGLDYVKEFQQQDPVASMDGRSSLNGRSSLRGIERLEPNIYGMWLWSDPAEASLALDQLPEVTRYRAISAYLANLVQPRFRTWRPMW